LPLLGLAARMRRCAAPTARQRACKDRWWPQLHMHEGAAQEAGWPAALLRFPPLPLSDGVIRRQAFREPHS
jgi:hypothetical protein